MPPNDPDIAFIAGDAPFAIAADSFVFPFSDPANAVNSFAADTDELLNDPFRISLTLTLLL